MKYINSYRNLFDAGVCFFTDGYLTNGTGIRINLGELEGDKLYIAYDMQRSNNSIGSTFLFRLYDAKNSICFSNYSKGTPSLTLENKSEGTIKAMTIKNSQWYRVYEVYDYKLGTVDMYVEGEFFASTTAARVTTPTYVILNLPVYNNDVEKHIGMKNIIISDNEFDMTDEVIDIPLKLVSTEWEEDIENNVYYTDEPGKKLVLGASLPAGYTVKKGFVYLTGLKKGKLSILRVNGVEHNIIPKETLMAPVDNFKNIEIVGLGDDEV